MDLNLGKFQDLVETEVKDILDWAKTQNKDVEEFAKAISADMVKCLKQGYSDLSEELMDQMLLLAEVSRIRLNRELKGRLKSFFKAAIKVAASLL
jgi:hypothetical protein